MLDPNWVLEMSKMPYVWTPVVQGMEIPLIETRTAGQKTHFILYDCSVEIGVWGTCSCDCGLKLCQGIDGWKESRKSPVVGRTLPEDLMEESLSSTGWMGRFGLGSQRCRAAFPICNEVLKQTFLLDMEDCLKERTPNAFKGIKLPGLREPGLLKASNDPWEERHLCHQCRTHCWLSGGKGLPVSPTWGSAVSTGRVQLLSDLCSFSLESIFWCGFTLWGRVQVVWLLAGALYLGPSEDGYLKCLDILLCLLVGTVLCWRESKERIWELSLESWEIFLLWGQNEQ